MAKEYLNQFCQVFNMQGDSIEIAALLSEGLGVKQN